MIKSLRIKNFVLVRDMELRFDTGLHVLTGETGAGKSVIAGAIAVIMGSPVRADMLYDPEQPAWLEATFEPDPNDTELSELIKKHDLELSDGEIFFGKEISTKRSGKSFINGRRVTASIIREFHDCLIDYSRQSDQSLLFDTRHQLDVLDRFGELIPMRNSYQEIYRSNQRIEKELDRMLNEEKLQRERIALYRYQIEELEQLGLTEGEDEKLEAELNMLLHTEEIERISNEIEQEVFETENSVFDRIQFYIKDLTDFENDNTGIRNANIALRDALANLDAAVQEMRQVRDSLETDPGRLSDVEDRINQINRIKQKYHCDLLGIFDYHEKIRREINSYTTHTDGIEKLKKELEASLKERNKQALALSKARKACAEDFSRQLEKDLKRLAIPEATFRVDFLEQDGHFTDTGIDQVEYLFSANRGVKPNPLRQVASGGELSRVHLTIMKILAEKDVGKTIIFDEVDTGIGGKTGDVLGEYIRNISDYHQIICITHLPQVASYAKNHLAIEKVVDSEHTEIQIRDLDEVGSIREIARMLSGDQSTLALEHAKELRRKNKERKG